MDTVNAVNKHNSEWPTGYVMSIFSGNTEIFQAGFNKCVDEMSNNFGTGSQLRLHKWQKDHSLEFRVIPFDEAKPVAVPIFTQAMKDAKELPPVGSWFIDVELGDNGTEVEAIAHDLPLKRVVYKSATAIEDCEYFGATIDECKVITPPIELIDGKAYQFDYDAGSNVILDNINGLYDNGGSNAVFWVKGNAYYATSCANIQLLEVIK